MAIPWGDGELAHAEHGASAAERYMACAGSLNRSRGLPDNSSPYAIEGTAAHAVAADCLVRTIEADEYFGQFIEVPTYGPNGEVARTTRIHVEEEMVEG